MSENFITNLKKKLPKSLQNLLGEDEDDSENGQGSEDNRKNDEAFDDDSSPNQLSTIIRVIVVIGVGYLAIDHFFLTPEQPVEIVKVAKKSKSFKKVEPASEVANTEIASPETASSEQTLPVVDSAVTQVQEAPITPLEQVIPTETTATAAPVENINITPNKIEEAPIELALEKPAEFIPQMGEVKSSEEVDKGIDHLIDSIDEKEKPLNEAPAKKEINLADKIVEDEVYTPPPAYDHLGRGLVYNCKEKYWACVDKSTYVTCNKNMKWNKSQSKTAECGVANIYNSDEDCGAVQKYNISSNAPTPFCQ